jgi:hypothetical protein
VTKPESAEILFEVPSGIREAKAALRKDLHKLLADPRSRGKWACYSRNGQVAIGENYLALIRECVKQGISDDAYIIERVEANAGSEEEEEIESRRA